MHKRKDGKVIASLTEVKNKTGDIFSLVDEFGEVLLTSYNKTKYKIVKVSISESITLDEPKEEKLVMKKPSVLNFVRETFVKEKKEELQDTTVYLIDKETITLLKSLKAFERDSKSERKFVSIIREPLQ